MIRGVWVIALNTFREAIRNKILYILLFVALGLIFSSLVLGKLSLDQSVRVIKDVGLGAISLFGVVIAIFIGINLLYQELDRKTLYTILVRPIARFQFVLGKYFGMILVLILMTFVMGAVLLGLLHLNDAPPDGPLLTAILLSFCELTVVVAVAVFFSAFSSPFLSGAFTFGIFVLGRLKGELLDVLPTLGLGLLGDLLELLARLLPNLYHFEVASYAIYGNQLTATYVLSTMLYGICYTALVLALACVLFGRRDIL